MPGRLLALAALVLALAACGGGDRTPGEEGVSPTSADLAGIPQQGLALGEPQAPRTLAVYGDVQCPFCARWDEDALPGIVDEHVRAGDLRIVFRGLAFIGPESELALRAVVAAGLQDRAWNLLGLLYANQGRENSGWVTEERLRELGGAVPGLDVDRMLADLHEPAVGAELTAAEAAAQAGGVEGTPSFELGPTGGPLEPVAPQELAAALAS